MNIATRDYKKELMNSTFIVLFLIGSCNVNCIFKFT